MSYMERVGVRELRQHASRYLAAVRAGDYVEVTDRGELVALMVPPPSDYETREDLIAAGLLEPGRKDLLDLEPLPAPQEGPTASEMLARMRASER